VGLCQTELGETTMKNVARRIAIVLSATAVTVGLMGAAAPAEAAKGKLAPSQMARDTQWD
jgi:hypothetical protein